MASAAPVLSVSQGPLADPREEVAPLEETSHHTFAVDLGMTVAVHGPRSQRPHLQARGVPMGARVVLWMAPTRTERELVPQASAHLDLGQGQVVGMGVADGGGVVSFAHALSATGGWTYRAVLLPQPGIPVAQVGAPLGPTGGTGWGFHAPQTGEIIVTEFMKDPVLVTDQFGEYIELWNTGPVDLDISGWILSDMGSDSLVLDNGGAPMIVPTRGHLVIAREVAPVFNGGIVGALEYVGMTLSNAADEIVLSRPDGTVVDEVVYLDGPDWPEAPGLSIELRQNRLGTRWNDLVEHWCLADTFYGLGDSGSPGEFNGFCP